MKNVKRVFDILLWWGLTGCLAFPTPGNIEDANVFHWENNYVTTGKFIQDHKSCLGVRGQQTKTQGSNIFNNMKPKTVPKWDGLWATFESRDFKEAGQRIAYSIPSEGGNSNMSNYKKCMISLGYNLTYKR